MSEPENEKIQLIEEQITIDKETVVTGKVRVSTATHMVEDSAQATLAGQRVQVTRKSINREIESVPVTRVEGELIIVPVVEEILVVEKRLVLIEEIHIRRIATSEEVIIPVALQKQTATIDRFEK